MLRTRLLTATAAVALFAAGSTFAQDATTAPTSPMPAPAQSAPMSAPTPAPTQAAPTAAAAGAETPAATNTVVDVLRANGQFTTLLTALDAAQLTDTLKTQPAISIFAPTDAAFAALPEADRTRLLDPANVNELRQLLLYHVVVADVNSSQIEGAKGGVETAANSEVQLDGTGDAIKVDNATVTTADLDASNGAVFVIDRVLNPAESQVAAGDADESTTATPPADETETATPPADEATDEGMTPPVSGESETGADTVGADAADAADAAPTPPASTTPAPSAAPTTTTPSSTTGVTAPNGQPAAATTTTASPPVANPTDGQVDGEADAEADTTAPTPTPQS